MEINKNKKVVHVAGDVLLQNTGFTQQFSIEVKELKKNDYDVSVLAFLHIRNFYRKDVINNFKEKYEEIGVNTHTVPTFLSGRIFLGLIYFPISWIMFLYLILFKKIRIFHFHEFYYLNMFLLLKYVLPINIRVFNDIHGVSIEEGVYSGRLKAESIRHKYMNILEKMAIKAANVNFCVSKNMINYYANKHDISLNCFKLTRSSFDPNIFKDFSKEKKEQSKKFLGLEGKIVFLYMGHKRAWQQTGEVLKLFKLLKKEIPDIFLLLLTNDIESIKKECEQLGIYEQDFLITYVAHEEVPVYSYSADVAIILRDDSIVNKVASPVKFSEYLASGAIIIISPNIGDLHFIVKKYNIGIAISTQNFMEVVSYLKGIFHKKDVQKMITEKCREVAEIEFSAQNTINTFTNCYNQNLRE